MGMEIVLFSVGILVAAITDRLINYNRIKKSKEELKEIKEKIESIDSRLKMLYLDYQKEIDTLKSSQVDINTDVNDRLHALHGKISGLSKTVNSELASSVEVKKSLKTIDDLDKRLNRFIKNYQNI